MTTRAYNEIFLDDAMENLGTAVEFATINCGVEGQEFLNLFVASGIAKEFGCGNVKYISGMSEAELASTVFLSCGKKIDVKSAELSHVDYSPEYWAGWILAYFQWFTAKSFSVILRKVTYQHLMNLYGVLHEADPQKAVSVLNNIVGDKEETNLAKMRKLKGLSQFELSKNSGVGLHSIQMYEQRKNNINNAQYNRLFALAAALCCEVEDIVE